VGLLDELGQAFDEMVLEMEGAKHQILLEMYWFASDKVGWRFATALSEAARRGVEVAVMYDAVGSWDSDGELFEVLGAAGAEVVQFAPIAPFRQRFRWGRLGRRNHRKMLVIDGKLAFIGGFNLGEEWLPREQGGAGWRDDVVKLEGPAAIALSASFWDTFHAEGGRMREHEACTRAPAFSDGLAVRVLTQNALRHRYQIVSAYLARIRNARRRIWLKNSYFVPDRRVRRALRQAASRGVDVRVILPARSDVPIARLAGRATYASLMACGVRIFEWFPSILHSKTAVVDSEWSTVGSFNLDHLSVTRSLEVNVEVLDTGFASQMERAFLKDLESCVPIEPGAFAQRPLRERLLETLFYQFRSFL
jgi:cardiolipin synthase